MAALTLLLIAMTVPASPAAAESPALNPAAKYAVNVPSSLLASAGGTAAERATLANGQNFNWIFTDARYSSVSGSLTSQPVAPASALSPADYSAFEAATAAFDAPAIPAAPLTKVLPGGDAIPLLAFAAGTYIGQFGARLFGFKDDQVCVQQNPLLTAAASALDGVDCTLYNLQLQKTQQNLDRVFLPTGNVSLCDAGVCVYLIAAQTNNTAITYCFARSGDWDAADRRIWGVTAYHGDGSYAGSGSGTYYCPNMTTTTTAFEMNDYSGKSVSSFETKWYTLAGHELHDSTLNVDPLTLMRENPDRSWLCTITTTDGLSYSAQSQTWTEQDSAAKAVQCPTLPSGKTAAHLSLQEIGTRAGGQNFSVIDSDTTSAYRAWGTAFPECTNGSCLLDLRRGTQSCFLQGIDCTGWFADPNRSTAYTCYYGTHAVALSECNIYAALFDEASFLDSGNLYADPGSGTSIQTPTSPTKEDQVVANMMIHGWDTWNPSSDKLLLGAGTGSEGEMAHTVARQCLTLHLEAQCTNLPVFAPGNDVPTATDHDLNAILGSPNPYGVGPQPAQLTWVPESLRAPTGWYDSTPPCVAGSYDTVGTSDSPPLQCDEYPYRSTAEGGPGSSLKPIPKSDNRNEGSYLQHFYNTCGVASAASPSANQFIVVPTPNVHTSVWCNGNAAP